MRISQRPEFRQFVALISLAAILTLLEYILIVRQHHGIINLAKHLKRHFFLISGIHAITLVLCAMLRIASGRSRLMSLINGYVASALFGTQTVGLILLYIANYFAISMLGGLLNTDLLRMMLTESAGRVQALAGSYAVAVMVVVLIGLLFLSMIFGRILTCKLPEFFDGMTRPKYRPFTVFVVVFYAIGLIYGIKIVVKNTNSQIQDPVIAAVYNRAFISNSTGSDEKNLAERAMYGSQPNARANGKNIIIIVSDSIRADHLPIYGYPRMTTPFLNSLYQGGNLHRVKTATSACSESICGIFAILGSKLISHAAEFSNFTLHQALKDKGYRIHFILSGSHSLYQPLPLLYGRLNKQDVFEHYTDGDLSAHGTDDRGVLEAIQGLPVSQGEANFFFIFLMSSHALGVQFVEHPPFQPTMKDFNPEKLFSNGGRHILGGDDRQKNINRYDNSVFQADSVIKQIFGTLQAKGYLGNAVTFITADHGEALGERGLYTHTKYVYPEFVRIPLLIYDPSDTRYRNIDFADQTDIAVTALDCIGLPKPVSWEGNSLINGQKRKIAFTQNDRLAENPCRGVYLRKNGKLNYMIQCEDRQGKKHEELFELESDPLGLKLLMNATPIQVIEEMRQRLDNEFPVRKNQL